MDIDKELKRLSLPQREKLERLLGGLSREEQVFVQEYTATLDRASAAELAGQKPNMGNRYLTERKYTGVRDAVDAILQQREATSELKAEYVRDYLMSILELCPTDHFVLGPDGDWMVDPQQFAQLPREIKRLVCGVELRSVRGVVMLKVEFVSKESALRMAVMATIGAKIKVSTDKVIPWETIAEGSGNAGADAIEERIRGLAPVQGPVQAEGLALAPCDVLQAAG